MMFHVCILRVTGTALTQAPTPNSVLHPASPFDWFGWCGSAAVLAANGQLPNPVGVQWVSFNTKLAAYAWLNSTEADTLLAGCFVTGYEEAFAPEHANDHLVLVASRRTSVSEELVRRQPGDCVNCPSATAGRWVNFTQPPADVQTLVLSFANATAWSDWRNSADGQTLLDNSLSTIRYVG